MVTPILFAWRSYFVQLDGDRVTILDRATHEVISEHGMGATTITGTSPALSADDRREIHALLRAHIEAVVAAQP